ncbi:hypothetical protein CEXT_811581 [Caerostris extrusa]|uniref:Uncharacterized protein n=1 Tax=Caerostris extrusa TaxID=172846 RepID=A0AAV4NWW7_CAEEX|nr:hypothetical protein CEXT_811581 [Caerostris extrusa]
MNITNKLVPNAKISDLENTLNKFSEFENIFVKELITTIKSAREEREKEAERETEKERLQRNKEQQALDHELKLKHMEGLPEEVLITPKVFQLLEEIFVKGKRMMFGEKNSEELVFSMEVRDAIDELGTKWKSHDLENTEINVLTTPVEANATKEEINEILNTRN